MDIQAEKSRRRPSLERQIGRQAGNTTPTDSRSRRNWVGRRGGHVKARVRNPTSERRPARPACSRCPSPRWSHHTTATECHPCGKRGVPDNFIPDKGKIEKRLDYLQRRLPPLCERYGIIEVDQARPLLEDIIGYYNEERRHQETGEIPAVRWVGGCGRGQGRLRVLPGETDLGLLFALHYERVVHSDGKVRFQGRAWSVSAPAGSWVTVCWRPAERVAILWNEQPVGSYAL